MTDTDNAITLNDGATLIDAWELPAGRVDEFVARWRERVGLIHTAPGFRDARLHRALDPRSRIGLVNVAHWDSIEARDRALAHPGFTSSARAATAYATVHGGWYEVVAALGPAGNGAHGAAGGAEEGPDAPVTFVNAFELPAGRVEEFLAHWRARAELAAGAPGFRDARLHRALDPHTRFQLVNIAHWDSAEAWRAAVDDPRFRRLLSASPGFAVAHPALYQVAVAF